MENDEKMVDSQEESSWTFYIEGFACENNDDDDGNSFSEYESPSLVSDATSSGVKKLKNINCQTRGFKNIMCKQNSFKKQKNRVLMPAIVIDYDHELEDTASSPVNSPKICYINQFMNQKEKGNKDVSNQVKRNIFSKGGEDKVSRI